MYLLARLAGLPRILRGVDLEDLDTDPIKEFADWYRLARRVRHPMPNAMHLATATTNGAPSVRVVLLKDIDASGFSFYTNYKSRKGSELAQIPNAALSIYWRGLERQIRVEVSIQQTSREQSEAYFNSRPRGSQLGAWASLQSAPLSGRAELLDSLQEAEQRFSGSPVPCPPHWGGYVLSPSHVEFWQGRASRLHDRFLYTRSDDGWKRERLSP